MTNLYVEEIYDLMQAAFRGGQDRIQVHIFPFRMTPGNLVKYSASKHMPFWRTLQPFYSHFQVNQSLAKVGVCNKRYVIGGAEESCVSPWHRQKARVIASRKRALRTARPTRTASAGVQVKCNLRRPSCRRWLALAERRLKAGAGGNRLARAGSGGRRATRVARR